MEAFERESNAKEALGMSGVIISDACTGDHAGDGDGGDLGGHGDGHEFGHEEGEGYNSSDNGRDRDGSSNPSRLLSGGDASGCGAAAVAPAIDRVAVLKKSVERKVDRSLSHGGGRRGIRSKRRA